MRKCAIYAFIFAALAICGTARCENSLIGDVTPSGKTATQYELFEISADIKAPYKNAVDPKCIEVDAVITTPSGLSVTVPAFYSGKGATWNARYTPTEEGNFSYSILLKTPDASETSKTYNFTVVKGSGDGFLRKSAKNPYYPIFDSGKSFFGLGHDIGWSQGSILSSFERYFIKYRENGCNLTRVWVNVSWSCPLENNCVGSYDMSSSEKIDALLNMAKEYGVYIVLVLDSYGSLMEEQGQWNENTWKSNPYNKANGGPCAKPWDFFTDETARQCYKNRLRYVMARWGYSPNILAFELWNETDAPAEWVSEMASYIRSVNPHGQFITTSLGYPWSDNFDDSSVWKLDGINIIDQHIYGNQVGEPIGSIASLAKELTKNYNKMFLVGEFGISSNQSDSFHDVSGTGLELHNSIWAAAMSRSFAGALNWWWEEYVRPKNLYHHYLALRRFLDGVDWNSSRVECLKTSPVKIAAGESEEIKYSDVTVPTKELWGNTNFREFTIGNNGEITGGYVIGYLHGTLKNDTMRIEPVFHVNYPADGKFIIKVGTVSQGGHLVAYVDDKEALSQDFPAGPGEGPWIKSTFRPDYKVYQCLYNTDVEVPVSKGEHVIRLSNTGLDWIGIKNIRLTNYSSSLFANARALGLALDKVILLWIQNKSYNLSSVREGLEPKEIKGASLTIEGAADGLYNIEWWNTTEGKITSTTQAAAKDKKLTLTIPSFPRDIACKIKR